MERLNNEITTKPEYLRFQSRVKPVSLGGMLLLGISPSPTARTEHCFKFLDHVWTKVIITKEKGGCVY